MKKWIAFFLACLGVYALNAQVMWLTNLERAKNYSAQSGKLMVIDFWASWCGPCLAMDRDLWGASEMKSVSQKFVPVRIDVDYDKSTALFYSASAIPKVVIALANGEVIWEKTGFSSSTDYIDVLRAIPDNISALYENLRLLHENEKDPINNLAAGKEYQKLAKTNSNRILRSTFLTESSRLFRKADKFTTDPNIIKQIELYSLLSDIYRDNPKKALKDMEKIDLKNVDKETEELSHFILALCYKALKDDQKLSTEKGFITKEEFANQLNE